MSDERGTMSNGHKRIPGPVETMLRGNQGQSPIRTSILAGDVKTRRGRMWGNQGQSPIRTSILAGDVKTRRGRMLSLGEQHRPSLLVSERGADA